MDQTSQMALQILVSGVQAGAIYALAAWGFTIVYNATGLINFAAGEFIMMGGMLTAAMPGSPFVTVPIAILIVAACAAAMDHFGLQKARRSTQLTLVMITIGMAIVLRGLVMFTLGKDFKFPPGLGGGKQFMLDGVSVSTQSLWIVGSVLVVGSALWYLFQRSWLGRAMRASSENPRAALLMGISPKRMSTVAFAIAGGMGALAGAMIAPIASANYDSGLFFGLKGFSAAVLGGLGSPLGALVGGLLLGLIESVTAGYLSSSYKDALALGLLVVMLLVRPSGLLGSKEVNRI
jgi:branched-chain amino acid transport system permease protein